MPAGGQTRRLFFEQPTDQPPQLVDFPRQPQSFRFELAPTSPYPSLGVGACLHECFTFGEGNESSGRGIHQQTPETPIKTPYGLLLYASPISTLRSEIEKLRAAAFGNHEHYPKAKHTHDRQPTTTHGPDTRTRTYVDHGTAAVAPIPSSLRQDRGGPGYGVRVRLWPLC